MKRTQVSVSSSISYQPFLTLPDLPPLADPGVGQAAPPNFNLAAGAADYFGYTAGVSASRSFSRRTSLGVSYSYSGNNFQQGVSVDPEDGGSVDPEEGGSVDPEDGGSVDPGEGGSVTLDDQDLSTQTFGVHLSYIIARGLSARIGYSNTEAFYSGELPGLRSHGLDGGIDFSRALSLSRRTTLAFSTGSAASVYQNEVHYNFVGSASLVHELGRSWNASLAYNRSVGFSAAYFQPVLSDGLTAGVTGLLNDRLSFSSSIGASFGSVGFSGPENRYDTYSASAGLTLSVTRYLGVNTSYTYFRYSFEENAVPVRLEGVPDESRSTWCASELDSVDANLPSREEKQCYPVGNTDQKTSSRFCAVALGSCSCRSRSWPRPLPSWLASCRIATDPTRSSSWSRNACPRVTSDRPSPRGSRIAFNRSHSCCSAARASSGSSRNLISTPRPAARASSRTSSR